eukprot:COSAG06_NODE_1167_length_10451_cov_16.691654_2_plen_64_part_00
MRGNFLGTTWSGKHSSPKGQRHTRSLIDLDPPLETSGTRFPSLYATWVVISPTNGRRMRWDSL